MALWPLRTSSMADYFDQADSYENVFSSNAREDGLKLVELLAPQKGSKVLHLGCATGYLTKVMADLVGPEGKVVGLDPDLERLKLAKEKYPASNLEYLEGRAEHVPVDDSDFDIVFSSYVLHWCKDLDVVLKESASKLKAGGKFGFVGITGQPNELLTGEMFSQEFRTAFTSSIHPIDTDRLRLVASSNNFTLTLLKQHVLERRFEGVLELIRYYMTHFQGKYGEEHFDAEAMKSHYGEGKFCIKIDLITALLEKVIV